MLGPYEPPSHLSVNGFCKYLLCAKSRNRLRLYSDSVSTARPRVGLLLTVGIFLGYADFKFTLPLH